MQSVDELVEKTPRIKLRPIEDLIPYARNARIHSDQQVEQIVASIREFGWTSPILLDGSNGIVAGHARLQAARRLNLKRVPCIELSHLSDAQKRAYIIADNKLTLNSDWDAGLLQSELIDLRDLDVDLSLTGFAEYELSALLELGVTKPQEEWSGMPEYDQQNKMAFRSIIIHFKDDRAVEQFAHLLKQRISAKCRFLWYPEVAPTVVKDKEYASES
jgi:ParB-like nuclease family protein